MAIKAQGTEVFALVSSASGDTKEVLRINCPKSFNLATGSADEIDVTCLESDAKEYLAGLDNPGNATFDINADPTNPSHIKLFQLNQDKTVIQFAVGWSDGKGTPPAINAAGDDFECPDTRTWLLLSGYVEAFPFNFAVNSAVESSISVKISGVVTWLPKTA